MARHLWTVAGALAPFLLHGFVQLAAAQDLSPGEGWTLLKEQSSLRFQSIKNTDKVESSSFASFSGEIDPSGAVQVRFLLDSVDTKVDLRNVRMRFLLFETFKYPEMVISTTVDPAMVADLAEVRRKTLPMPYTVDLHGVTKSYETEVVVTLINEDMVSVASSTPVSVAVADFNLLEGVRKLEEAAKVTIVPTTTVSFDFVFARNGSALAPGNGETGETGEAQTAAQETQGDFSVEECNTRFETLSRTGNIYFRVGSARLDGASMPLLESLVGIIQRCPGLVVEVSGHTDSDGSDRSNQRLSEARAGSVAQYIAEAGIDAARLVAVGRGESMPAFPNDSAENKARNRRIEFAIVTN